LVSARRGNKYISKLGIIFLLLIVFTSCSENKDKFNLVLKSYSGNNDNASISFRNLESNEIIKKNIKRLESLETILNLDVPYEILYENRESDIFAYIKEIIPRNYSSKKVYLTLNKNNSFRSMKHLIQDSIEENEKYYYLYKKNHIYRVDENHNFKKLSLLTSETKTSFEEFNIDNKVINLDGEYLINNDRIAFIDEKDEISFIGHNIDLDFISENHVKVADGKYFIVLEKENYKYNCVDFIVSKGNIEVSEVENCTTLSDNKIKILSQKQKIYLWNTSILYEYKNKKFEKIYEFDKSGEVFQNNDNFYLISNKNIFFMGLKEGSLSKLDSVINDLNVLDEEIKIFKINNNTNLISSDMWSSGKKYYIFNDDSGISLEEYDFSDEVVLKNIVNIKIDKNQNIFFNNSTFQISNIHSNEIKFYKFSYFK